MDTIISMLTPEETKVLRQSFSQYVQSGMTTDIVNKHFDLDVATMTIVQASCLGQVVKFYESNKFMGMMYFDVGHTWWTKDVIITERFILSVFGTHGVQRAATKFLDELATKYHARIISSGCFFLGNPRVVANGYHKAGFVDNYPTFVKEVNNDSK